MELNVFAIILFFFTDAVAVIITTLIGRRFETRLLSYIAIGCFTLSSGLGIFMNRSNESYLASSLVFLLLMTVIICKVVDGQYVITLGNKADFFGTSKIERMLPIVSKLGMLSFAIVFISTFYPTNYLAQLTRASFGITGERFALTLSRSSGIAWIMDRIKLVLLPFFFIWLYTLRKKWKLFIPIYVVYQLCIVLQEAVFTARSSYIEILLFVLFYLAFEHYIDRKQLIIIGGIILVAGVVVMVVFKNNLMGINSSYNGWKDAAYAFLKSEYSGGQARLDFCNSVSGNLDFFHYIYHCFTAPLFFLPDDGFPTLSYYFTTSVLGTRYGQVGYYVILPGAFGEGVMIFGKSLAWIYGIFTGLYAGILFRFLRKHEYLKYVYLYFLIQFAFSFRGSIQSFVLRSFNCMFYFMIMIWIIGLFKKPKIQNADLLIRDGNSVGNNYIGS